MSVLIFIVKFLWPVTISREINDPDLLRLFEICLSISRWLTDQLTVSFTIYLNVSLS